MKKNLAKKVVVAVLAAAMTIGTLSGCGKGGTSSASALYQSVLCFITIVLANLAVKKYDKDYGLF